MGFFFAGKFLDYLRHERRFSEHTCIAYERDLMDFSLYLDDNFQVKAESEISTDMVRSWVSSMIAAKKEAVTVKRKISALRTFFRYLLKERILDTSPVRHLPQLKSARKLPAVIESESMEQILDADFDRNEYTARLNYLIVSMLYGTGFRRAELISVKEQDIDFSGRVIRVLGKRNKERMVPVTHELAGEIEQFIELKKQKGLSGAELFVNEKNRPLYPGYIYNVVKKYLTLQKAGGKRSPHILRHTYATRLLQNGAELLSVKELLGHSSLASTQVYTHVNIEDLKKIYKKSHPKQ